MTQSRLFTGTVGIGSFAVVAAVIGPIQSVAGWLISASLWPAYNPVTQTISDLAADDSPVKWVQSSFFLLGGTLSLVAAWHARALALPGRIIIAVAGLTTYGLTIFATPTQLTSSFWHRVFAIITFVLMSAWPLFSIRRDPMRPWVIRPIGGIAATLVFTVASVAFLSVWTDPAQPLIGVWERAIAVGQVAYLSFVILTVWNAERAPRSSPESDSGFSLGV